LTDPRNTPAFIAEALLHAGVPDCHAIVAENLGMADEAITDMRLRALVDRSFAALNVLLLVQDDGWRPAPQFSPRPDSAYAHRRGLITKADVRALSLARLLLSETDTVWDVGAGSGAVSLEMAEIAWRGRVYAVERDAENIAYIRENISRYGMLNVEVVEGTAPEALRDLPAPEAVFIGGTGGGMQAILEHIEEKTSPGCRVVANLATIENLQQAVALMKSLGWSPEVTQVSISYGQEIAGHTRLAPINPVFIVSGTKR
jgi:precorrin-6Y C5,15-methyltransferase (decarboxylating)